MTTKPDSEDALENATIDLLMNNGWGEWANCIGETTQNFPVTGRSDRQEVVLYDRLRAALKRLNPDIPAEGLSEAVDTLTRDRSAMLLPQANQEVYGYLKNGIRVNYQENGRPQMKLVQVIDWKNWAENDFFLTQQMWITGDVYTRRADVIGFVNGLPLLFIELKRSSVSVERAYEDNLRDYKNTIPQLFWYNAVVLLSNGRDARLGSLTSPLAHYGRWKKINSEGEEGRIDLETILLAACRPSRLLDLIENFTVFSEGVGGLSKIVAKNHQFLGVNNAIGAVHQIQENRGRLGVFWHTQGSGKSYSMLFFAQKTLRKIQGNWTFVIITDRRDLDDQIYKNFAAAGAVTEPETTVRAQSANHLRQLLQEDHRYVFTLIQKFRTDPGEVYPVLSERSDIIVMTDEAHRSQYDTLAQNMRNALPNAAFIGFTGTPLMAGEEKTREVFGDYVSIYDFSQSIEDEATVPLFYENRIPSVQLTNEHFNEELEALLEEAALDEDQEKKLEREFAREYHIITRDDRLEKVAQDIVSHFVGRGYRGKGMVVSIDKLTAARLYQKVARHWSITLAQLHGELADCDDEMRRDILQDDIKFMETTDLGLVISQSQNEIDFFKEHDFDILPHRKLMESGQVDTRFKDPEDSLRLVFVCAMWLTGFDAPSVSTVYLDKPMRNHTLMQTIARANRVFKGKINGTIVDYIGVFRNLQEALAIYGEGVGGQVPVQPKEELISQLASALSEGRSFCAKLGVDILSIVETDDPFSRIAKIENGVERILKTDETKKTFLAISGLINRLFKAILPDPAANPYWGERSAFKAVADHIHSLTPSADISEVMTGIEELLDRSIEGYKIGDGRAPYNVGGIDFDAIRKMFEKGKKRTAAARLRGQIEQQLDKMIQQNKSRLDYAKKLQEMIKAYNEGITGVDEFMQQLFDLSNALEEESKRAIREGLEEEELAIFDILLKPRPELTKEDLKQVKAVAKTMLDTLKAEVLLLDWRHQQQRRSAVRVRIEALLDELPDSYESGLFDEKCDAVYDHVYENYQGGGQASMGSERWFLLRESLLLLRLLQAAPANQATLIGEIQQLMPEAFAQPTEKSRQRHFERVLDAARTRLAAEIGWDPVSKIYTLDEPSPYLGLSLGEAEQHGLGFLLHLFAQTEAELQNEIQPLLDFLTGALSTETLKRLERSRPNLQINLSRLDEGEITSAVWQRVNYGIQKRHLLRFLYCSPRHADRQPRLHTLEPFTLDFDQGHYYLEAYCRQMKHPDGREGGNHWARYRLDHIDPSKVEVLPTTFSKETRSQRLIPIRYKIAPQIARGNVTYHFDDMTFAKPDAEGWVEVSARAKNLFDAYRTLLALGPMCVVLAPESLVNHMYRTIGDMLALYSNYYGDVPPPKSDGQAYIQ